MRVPALALLIAASLAGAAQAQQLSDQIAPEAATGTGARQIVTAETQMVSAANPLAAQAGIDILRAGGSAADALVAVQTVLGLVEPQSSGLGGGAFALWYDAETGEGRHHLMTACALRHAAQHAPPGSLDQSPSTTMRPRKGNLLLALYFRRRVVASAPFGVGVPTGVAASLLRKSAC